MYNRRKLNEEDVKDLKEEVEVMKSLDHPNITKFIEIYEEKDYFCLVFELMVGGEVSTFFNLIFVFLF